MPFQINGTSPPSDAGEPRSPVGGGSSERLVLPETTGRDGLGRPVGATGRPRYEVYFDVLPAADWAWYANFTDENPSVELTGLQVWNPYVNNGAGQYTTYTTARMHRPVYERMCWGGTAYEGVTILFTGLAT